MQLQRAKGKKGNCPWLLQEAEVQLKPITMTTPADMLQGTNERKDLS